MMHVPSDGGAADRRGYLSALPAPALRSPVTRKGVVMMTVPSDGGPQTDAVLGLLYLPGLLLSLELSRVRVPA